MQPLLHGSVPVWCLDIRFTIDVKPFRSRICFSWTTKREAEAELQASWQWIGATNKNMLLVDTMTQTVKGPDDAWHLSEWTFNEKQSLLNLAVLWPLFLVEDL